MLKVPCPNCKSLILWTNNSFRPFCSERCKDRDLGKWANEEYRLPVEEEKVGGDDLADELEKRAKDAQEKSKP